MQNLIRFVLKYNFPLLFLVLVIISLLLLIRNNPIPHSRLYSSVQSFNGFVYNQVNKMTQYVQLRDENESLARENARLRTQRNDQAGADSLDPEYTYIQGNVVNNSIHHRFNYITLNIGSKAGVVPEMAVVSPEGIVGLVKNVSENFSVVISLLNPRLSISVMHHPSQYFGSLTWPGKSHKEFLLSEIPSHAGVNPGDSIFTSGYSSIFPPGELVGFVVSKSAATSGNFMDIVVASSTDFKKLSRVYVVDYKFKDERIDLESIENAESDN